MARAALILAPDDRSAQKVFGVPAVRRLVLLLQRLGVKRIHVLGRVQEVHAVLSDLLPPEALHPVPDPAAIASAAAQSVAGADAVLVLLAHLVFDRRSLGTLLQSEPRGKEADRRAIAAGAALTTPPDLPEAVRALWAAPPEPRAAPSEGAAPIPHVLGRGEAAARSAEAALVAALGSQTQEDDGFLARHVDRPISRAMSKRLARTGITPNQITLCGATIGMIGAYLLSRPGYASHALGAFLFLFAVIVDGVDGEIARLKLKESAFGHYLDIVTDNLVHAAIFIGIAVGLYRDTQNPLYLNALWLMLGGFCVCLVAVYVFVLRKSPDELARSPLALRVMAFATNRDFAYLVAVLALVGRLNWFVVGSAVGTYVFAAALWALSAYERRSTSREV